jgi:hypothetical protein
MKNRKSLNRTLVFSAALAALAVSVDVPVEPALAAQVWAAQVVRVPRARPLELAATAIERVGQKRGMGDGSKHETEIAAFEAYRKQGMRDGSVRQGGTPGRRQCEAAEDGPQDPWRFDASKGKNRREPAKDHQAARINRGRADRAAAGHSMNRPRGAMTWKTSKIITQRS